MDYKHETEWYNSLIKPPFQPPSWVFKPVWTALYLMMFVSFSLILLVPYRPISIFAYVFFVIQLVLNISWSPTFFVFHDLRKSFYICFLLTLTVFLMLITFFYISKIAGLLIVPYFLWLVFATVLNFEIWELNSD